MNTNPRPPSPATCPCIESVPQLPTKVRAVPSSITPSRPSRSKQVWSSVSGSTSSHA
uniref:Uncharacterized protein n=1 Tax=uncultured marine virus TaxID=186617 RepID=A0A0F7L2B8_9VIRU|nr:hypothetical protein [uncultured marine virus]